jgi:hypothetical protein
MTPPEKNLLGTLSSSHLEEWQGFCRDYLDPRHRVTFHNGDVNDESVTLFVYCDKASFNFYSGLLTGWKVGKGILK